MIHLPRGWASARLADVADVQLGRQRSPKNHIGPNMRPYLRAANVTWNGLSLDDVKQMQFSPAELETFQLEPGDILLSEASGSASEVGKPAIWGGEIKACCFQNTLLRVRTQHLEPKYLLWFFKWLALSGQFARGSRGVGIHHLGARALSEWVIPIAPVAEQRRIVAAIEEQLSRLDVGLVALDRAWLNIKRIRAVVMDRSFWDVAQDQWVKLELLGTIVTGSTPTTTDPENYGDGLPFITPSDFNHAERVKSAARSLSPSGAQLARPLPVGSVLTTCIGATLGKVAIANVPCATNQQINAVIPGDRVSSEYLFYCLTRPAFTKTMWDEASSTTIPILNKSRFSALRIPVVAPSKQEAIAEILTEELAVINDLSAEMKRVQARARRLRLSILATAFFGKLVSQDPSDESACIVLDRIAAQRASGDGHRAGLSHRPRYRTRQVSA